MASFTASQLRAILLYHVVPGGVFYSTALKSGNVASALDGQTVAVAVSAQGVTVNDARVVLADTFTTAGVIHFIDKILTPAKIPENVPIPGSTPTTGSAPAPTSSAKAPASLNSGAILSSSLLSVWFAIAAVFFM